MKIAICDDEPKALSVISSLLGIYQAEKKVNLVYRSFSSSFVLLEEMRKESFDLLFLDIMMPGISGIQVAREIRTFDKNTKIVFLTSTPEFAVESYSVMAYTYLLKPITHEILFPVMDNLYVSHQDKEDSFIIKGRDSIIKISFSTLMYVEVLGKTLFFYMIDGTFYEIKATLSEYEKIILSHHEFQRVHRSFIVNMWQMKELKADSFTTYNGKHIPISRRMYQQVRNAYIKSLFTKKEIL